jgi:hypothetical protein
MFRVVHVEGEVFANKYGSDIVDIVPTLNEEEAATPFIK